ncbi:polysaccharide deacetylase [Paenibacillus mucilaginosus 3016]|uniref:Polysaccharide deacetylase n=1 Tax=Paenibacillus mucilaginosus 3016 TaxID=1116391 RepID=H6NBS1_9BACL|nr:polysaccharide deacetylase family protein [Paenibacillus mucilaginosus]AFC27872.1 polysaccharide deacetylase [Paenibacillus mucilaginosus 3016]WFA16737.1 polysaccharide deacetylase family protein [Paenibacillus mucilaginosus]
MNRTLPAITAAFLLGGSLLLSSCAPAAPKSAAPLTESPAAEPPRDEEFMPKSANAGNAPTVILPPAALNPSPTITPTLPTPVPQSLSAPAPVIPPAAPIPRTKAKPKSQPTAPTKPAKETVSVRQQLTLSQLTRKYPNLLVRRGPTSSKKAALTFDDAPDDRYTEQVLDTLAASGVKATFFVLGSQASKYPDVVRRMAREGHVIGSHSYQHALFPKLTDERFHSQIEDTEQTLLKLVGYKPRLLRPPYGEITESQLLWAGERGLKIVNWNVDSLDWKQLGKEQVTANILRGVEAGSIILQHSGGGPGQDLSGTVAALPGVIASLRAQGYQLVTLPELLQVSKQLK